MDVSFLPSFPSQIPSLAPLKVYVRHQEKPPPTVTPAPMPSSLLDPDPQSLSATSSSTSTIMHRSTHISKPLDRYSFPALLSTLDSVSIPSSFLHAAKETCWQKAMAEELLALEVNRTWD